jgi:hypothetical protein
VISAAVLGFLISFNARKTCSLSRRLEFEIFFIAASIVSKEPNQLNPAVLARLKANANPYGRSSEYSRAAA